MIAILNRIFALYVKAFTGLPLRVWLLVAERAHDVGNPESNQDCNRRIQQQESCESPRRAACFGANSTRCASV